VFVATVFCVRDGAFHEFAMGVAARFSIGETGAERRDKRERGK
jgi:hypothetical protein